ncbi:mCG144693, partial [Mus musculus]
LIQPSIGLKYLAKRAAAQESISWSWEPRGFTMRGHPTETWAIHQVFLLPGGQELVASQAVGSNRCSNHERARLLRKPPHSRSSSKRTESSPPASASRTYLSQTTRPTPTAPHAGIYRP